MGTTLAVALSGGPDSVALVLLAEAVRPGKIIAATVDHGLRAASAAEAQFAAKICGDIGVHHTILNVTLNNGNVQAEARRARYAALGEWLDQSEAGALLTAHHANDQAETLLMRLNRGSGVGGLAGIRRIGVIPGHGGDLLRPLLAWKKVDLEKLAHRAGFTPVCDPSNTDDRYDRARMRKALAQSEWLDTAAIAQSAAHLDGADRALEWAAMREWDECVTVHAEGLSYRPSPDCPRELRFRVLMRGLIAVGERGDAPNRETAKPRGEAVSQLLGQLELGLSGNVAGVLAKPVKRSDKSEDGPAWALHPEPARTS